MIVPIRKSPARAGSRSRDFAGEQGTTKEPVLRRLRVCDKTRGRGRTAARPLCGRGVPLNIAEIPVFILCGGLGTRLKDMTEFRP